MSLGAVESLKNPDPLAPTMQARQTPPPLAGRHIVVTRPAAQAGPLAAAIEAAGGRAVMFPVLAIGDVEDSQPLFDAIARLAEFDLAVFVSPNAIDKTFAAIRARGAAWPARLRVAALGKSSERALAGFGIADVIAPRLRFDSEALLELPELQVMAGKRVIIFRGDGGRELIAETLRDRGATIEYVTCYRRGMPPGAAAELAPLLGLWQGRQLDAFTITSSEGLRNLHALLGQDGQAMLEQTPLFVPHARIAEEARRLGLQRVVPTAPGDAGLLSGLTEYFSLTKPGEHGEHGENGN